MRSVDLPEYHTSADDMDLIDAGQLGRSLEVAARIVEVLEGNRRYRNESPFGEPQLGRRGLHGGEGRDEIVRARLWALNQSDGEHSLLDIAERSGLSFDIVAAAADSLVDAGLLSVAEEEAAR
jgi:aminopeptidase-like protein